MTLDASALPPAGWYDDPQDATALRFWDGTQWLADTRPRFETPAPAAEPAAAAPVAPEPVVAQQVVAEQVVAEQVIEPAAAEQTGLMPAQEPAVDAPVSWAPEQSWAPAAEAAPVVDPFAPSGDSPFAAAADPYSTPAAVDPFVPTPTETVAPTSPEPTPAEAVPAWLAMQQASADVATPAVVEVAEEPLVEVPASVGEVVPEGAAETAAAGDEVTVVTTASVPGAGIERVLGVVVGIAVCRPGALSGSDESVAATLQDTTRRAFATLRAEAAAIGANAVVDTRYERASLPDLIEVTVVGTAVATE